MGRKFADTMALALLLAATAVFAWRVVDFSIPPFEDSAMLMRYADHVARGEGIVWNVGEPPVDGATDFLFMVVIACLRRFGSSLETAVRFVTILSHFATIALIYWGMRKLQGSGTISASLTAGYFAVGPGLFLSAAYFGTPFFALAVAVAWLLAQRIMFSRRGSSSGYLTFSLVCLTVGLIRPEGVLISLFMLIAVGVVVPRREFWRLALIFGTTFVVLGGTYFLWRWNYFGHPLPNPFYKKGGGHFYVSGLKGSVLNSFRLLYPFIPAFLISARRPSLVRLGVASLIPIAGSIGMWVLLSNEMNFGGRFQYPTLAICALSWFPLVKSMREQEGFSGLTAFLAGRRKSVIAAAVVCLALVFGAHIRRSTGITYGQDGRYDIGVMLSDYADRGYTIATTEAGLLPLYSGWRAIDLWGLNDPWIAHHGGVTEEYLNLRQPDVLMWHAYFSPLYPPSPERRDPWYLLGVTLLRYAEQHDYTLAAVFGVSPQDTHYYYVRSGLPESAEIAGRIRATAYAWYENGGRCEDYARVAP